MAIINLSSAIKFHLSLWLNSRNGLFSLEWEYFNLISLSFIVVASLEVLRSVSVADKGTLRVSHIILSILNDLLARLLDL